VAVSASLAVLAVGTETDGSVICPASINGIVGIKPTVGLVSRDGIIPIAHSQDTAGPMARTVRDAALLLQALAVPDPGRPVRAATDRPATCPTTPADCARTRSPESASASSGITTEPMATRASTTSSTRASHASRAGRRHC
jgi:Asp-tRNA(Asn)/Glu-tRNA(Gln) amidotransferase A subunit family amidase